MATFRSGFLVTIASVAILPGVARAAGGTSDAAQAEVLFEEGRRLMASGDYAAACPKLAESQAREPAAGTALNLAVCYEKAGKLASAWAAFKTAESLSATAGQKDRLAVAKKKAAQLQAAASRLTITVPPASQVAGLEVRRDGDVLQPPEWGVSTPRDGGGHDVQASAPGKKPWARHLELQPSGQSLVVEIPLLEDAPVAAPPLAAERQPAPAAPANATEKTEPGPGPGTTTSSSRSHVLDWSLMGGGAALGAAGAILMAVEANSASGAATHHDKSAYDSASAAWTVGLVATIVGAAALVGGGVVFFAVDGKPEAHGSRPSVWVGAGLGEARLGGTW